MDPRLAAGIIAAVISGIGYWVSHVRWRKDVQIRLGEIRDEVTVELVRQRLEPYAEFFGKIEMMSQFHVADNAYDKDKVREFMHIIQEAMYGKVGLLASHHTRFIMGLTRKNCRQYCDGGASMSYEKLKQRIWALQLAIKGDLGIPQYEMGWPSEIDRLRKIGKEGGNQAIVELVNNLKTHTYGHREGDGLCNT